MAAHADRPALGGLTPSDVSLPGVTQDELDRLAVGSPVTEVLPLSPTQQGLLFHARYAPEALDVHNVQLVFELEGSLDPMRLRRACQQLVDRHDILRTRFVQLASGEPAQVVSARVPLPWQSIDLREPGEPEPRQLLDELLAHDRLEPFDTGQAPLLRGKLVRLGKYHYALVLTQHHLLADGWSGSILLRDLAHLYQRHGDPAGLPGITPYRRYLEWLDRQDTGAARAAWQKAMADLPAPTLVAPDADVAHVRALPETRTVLLPAATTAALAELARTHAVTLNTVVQVAWALTLHRLTGLSDIVFGSTVSGRSPELPGYADIVGLMITTVPVRVRLDAKDKLGTLLAEVQGQQAELTEHHHLALGEIRRVADAGALFDTCLVFENYATPQQHSPSGTLSIAEVRGHDPYHFPLKLTVTPEERLHLVFGHRPDLLSAATAERAATGFTELLTELAERSAPSVGEFLPDPGRVRAVQDTLAGLVAEVLGTEAPGLDDDFFRLGGDSLLAMRLTGRIQAVLESTVDIRAIFHARTVRRIAARCVLASPGSPGDEHPQPTTKGTR
jgi:hypothetical protein